MDYKHQRPRYPIHDPQTNIIKNKKLSQGIYAIVALIRECGEGGGKEENLLFAWLKLDIPRMGACLDFFRLPKMAQNESKRTWQSKYENSNAMYE